MDIKQVGLIERIFRPKSLKPVKQTETPNKVDQVSISSSALKKFRDSADQRIKDIVMNSPDVRAEKVRDLKTKINNDTYYKSIDNDMLADKILGSPFGFNIKPQ
ncbi:MAG: flagellar biosynthesis anti-sigma factor FlgM [Spirochaetota bacterium]|nr:flagellar biosynthesis anti-sigma factor FlgM [Spirochaetota bacterium]